MNTFMKRLVAAGTMAFATALLSTGAQACFILNPTCSSQPVQIEKATPPAGIPQRNDSGYDMSTMHHQHGKVTLANGKTHVIPQKDPLSCTAELILGEAGDQKLKGQQFVVDTIKNRAAVWFRGSSTICDVVHKFVSNGDGTDTCQFTFACQSHVFLEADWLKALELAKAELSRPGVSDPRMVGVTYYYATGKAYAKYYADGVGPSWRHEMDCDVKEAVHVFCTNEGDGLYRRPETFFLAYSSESSPAIAPVMAYATEPARVRLPVERPTEAIEAAAEKARLLAETTAKAQAKVVAKVETPAIGSFADRTAVVDQLLALQTPNKQVTVK
jgi:hypothetical protein